MLKLVALLAIAAASASAQGYRPLETVQEGIIRNDYQTQQQRQAMPFSTGPSPLAPTPSPRLDNPYAAPQPSPFSQGSNPMRGSIWDQPRRY